MSALTATKDYVSPLTWKRLQGQSTRATVPADSGKNHCNPEEHKTLITERILDRVAVFSQIPARSPPSCISTSLSHHISSLFDRGKRHAKALSLATQTSNPMILFKGVHRQFQSITDETVGCRNYCKKRQNFIGLRAQSVCIQSGITSCLSNSFHQNCGKLFQIVICLCVGISDQR